MSRRPTEPRYYPSRRAYYVQVGGKQVLLAKGDRDDPVVLKEAWQRFREVVLERESKAVVFEGNESSELYRKASRSLRRVIDVMENTGCRPSEVCILTAANIDADARAVRIDGRSIPCEELYFDLLERMAKVATDKIFLNARGQPWSVDAIHGAFVRLRDRLGLRQELTPFSFRHSFAKRRLKETGSITDLASVLGISKQQARRLYG